MKRNLLIGLGLVGLIALTSCDGGGITASPDEITKAVLDSKVFEDEMVEVTDDKLDSYFNIEKSDLEDYSAYIAGSGGYADEVAVFKAADKDSVDKIKQAVEKRIEKRESDFDGYVQEEFEKLGEVEVEVNGLYVTYTVSGDKEKAKDAYNSAIK